MTRLVQQGRRPCFDAATSGVYRKSLFRQVLSRFRDAQQEKAEESVKLNTGKVMLRAFVDDVKAGLEKMIHGSEEDRRRQDEILEEIEALQAELAWHAEDTDKPCRTQRKIRMEIKEKEIELERLRESGKEALALLYRVCTEGGSVDVTGADIFTSYTLFQHQLMDLNGNVEDAVQDVVLACVVPDLKKAARNKDAATLPLKLVAPYSEDEAVKKPRLYAAAPSIKTRRRAFAASL